MSFFNEEIIYDFMNITDPKNSDDIIDILLDDKIKYNEITDYYYIYTKKTIEENKYDIIDLTSDLCDYLNDYLIGSLFVRDIDYIIIGRKKFNSDGKILLTKDTVCGILIAQKGECKEYPTYWTVRLICNLSETICKNYATKLLGAYMLMLVKMKEENPLNYQKYGVLELAGAYDNLAGYCTYSKLGFIEDYNFKCAAFNRHNLLMTSNVDDITIEDIYNTVRENTRFKQNKMTGRSEKTIKRPICLYQNTEFKNSIIDKLKKLRISSLPIGKTYTEETLTKEEKEIMNSIIEEDLIKSKKLNEEKRSTKSDIDIKELLELREKKEKEEEEREKKEREDLEFSKLLKELAIETPKKGLTKKKIDYRLEEDRTPKEKKRIPEYLPRATKKFFDPYFEEKKYRKLLKELGIEEEKETNPILRELEEELGLLTTKTPIRTKKRFDLLDDELDDEKELLRELGIKEPKEPPRTTKKRFDLLDDELEEPKEPIRTKKRFDLLDDLEKDGRSKKRSNKRSKKRSKKRSGRSKRRYLKK
jgi:hypothetical protein